MPRAREYFESFPCPPPSTIYGMLLSMVGEVNRYAHEGAELAIAMLSEPEYSVVLRKLWRVKKKGEGLGLGENRRPDFQELLTDIRLAVWVRKGQREDSDLSLASRVQATLSNPRSIFRFGGVSLGESTHLVDEVTYLSERAESLSRSADKSRLLMAEHDGDLSLPIWPDHVGSRTTWGQYRLVSRNLLDPLPEQAWTSIKR